jgi:hypothetical protein
MKYTDKAARCSHCGSHIQSTNFEELCDFCAAYEDASLDRSSTMVYFVIIWIVSLLAGLYALLS